MANINQPFGTRIDQLDRQRKDLANGYYTTIRNDGLVIAHPHRRDKGAPLKYFLALVVLFFIFQESAMAHRRGGNLSKPAQFPEPRNLG